MEKDNRQEKENLHKNHRQRVFDRLDKDGLDSFYDHEIIELLLFNTISRIDTNPIAHRLINEFGSIAGVMDADTKSLEKVRGVSHKSAVLLSMIPQLIRRYNLDNLEPKKAIDSFEKACVYAKALVLGEKKEVFYILCLDSKNRLIKAEKLKEGTANEIVVNPRTAVVAATKHESAGVILVHNHPRGSLKPSDEDISLTKKLALALGLIGIPIIDHIIVSDEEALSFKREGIMREVMQSVAVKMDSTKTGYS